MKLFQRRNYEKGAIWYIDKTPNIVISNKERNLKNAVKRKQRL